MAKCILCRPGNPKRDSEWSWQPFGPAETVANAARPGYHYRGFPTLPLCGSCLDDLVKGARRSFTYRKQHFVVDSWRNEITHHSQPVELGAD